MPLSTSNTIHLREKHYIVLFTGLHLVLVKLRFLHKKHMKMFKYSGDNKSICYFDNILIHFSCKNIWRFQLHKCEYLLLFSPFLYNFENAFGWTTYLLKYCLSLSQNSFLSRVYDLITGENNVFLRIIFLNSFFSGSLTEYNVYFVFPGSFF